MMSEQVDIAKEWLFECCDASEDGKVCACTIKRYITHLEAELPKAREENERLREYIKHFEDDTKRLDKLLAEGCYYLKRLTGQVGPIHTREQLDAELEEPHE